MDRQTNPRSARIRTFGAAQALAFAATVALAACKLGGGGSEAEPAQSAAATTATGTDVVRYAGMEAAETGTLVVRQMVRARRAADHGSEIVGILQPGNSVTRVARYGAFTLVSWNGPNGPLQGWVDTAAALRTNVVLDAGVGFVGLGNPTPTNTVPPPPPPTTTAARPQIPATARTAPPPPPPATTTAAPPPPPATTTAAKPPPPPPTSKPGFKPPKLK